MNKNFKKYIFVTLIICAIYSCLSFIVPFPHKSQAIFWISYIFGFLSIAVQPLIAIYGFKNSETLKSKLYGWPIIKLGYVYLIVQLSITLVSYIVDAFVEIPLWILLIINIIIICLTLIGLVINESYKDAIENIEINAPITTKFINDLKIDSKMLAKKDVPLELKEQLNKLADEIRYSDPVSTKQLTEIEDEINRKFIQLKEIIIIDKQFDAKEQIDNLILLIKERNKIAKANKS